jgi:hypothetical protein
MEYFFFPCPATERVSAERGPVQMVREALGPEYESRLDGRTGRFRFRNFRIQNAELATKEDTACIAWLGLIVTAKPLSDRRCVPKHE